MFVRFYFKGTVIAPFLQTIKDRTVELYKLKYNKPKNADMDRVIEKKKWSKKKTIWAAVLAVLTVIILYTIVFSDHSLKLNVEDDQISYYQVNEGSFQEYIPVTGTIRPVTTFFLDVTDGGRVINKFVQEGAFVNQGDKIIQLDNARLSMDIMYNEAQLFLQQNNLRSTRLNMEQHKLNQKNQLLELEYQIAQQKRIYEQNAKLFDKNLISDNSYKDSKDYYSYLINKKKLLLETIKKDSVFIDNQVSQLESSVKQMDENLRFTKLQLENLTVKAPISGQLTSLKTEIGQSISPGQNLGQIDVTDSFKVRAQIDEHYISRVSPGQTAAFTINGVDYNLEVATVYPEVRNGTFEVDLHFKGKVPPGIRTGQTLQVRLVLGGMEKALLVEKGGFYQSTGGEWIFVVDPSGSYAYKRKITLGRQNPQYFEILSGLKPGERVVTSPYESFGDAEKLVLK